MAPSTNTTPEQRTMYQLTIKPGIKREVLATLKEEITAVGGKIVLDFIDVRGFVYDIPAGVENPIHPKLGPWSDKIDMWLCD